MGTNERIPRSGECNYRNPPRNETKTTPSPPPPRLGAYVGAVLEHPEVAGPLGLCDAPGRGDRGHVIEPRSGVVDRKGLDPMVLAVAGAGV